jgi:hypothetical protein
MLRASAIGLPCCRDGNTHSLDASGRYRLLAALQFCRICAALGPRGKAAILPLFVVSAASITTSF